MSYILKSSCKNTMPPHHNPHSEYQQPSGVGCSNLIQKAVVLLIVLKTYIQTYVAVALADLQIVEDRTVGFWWR